MFDPGIDAIERNGPGPARRLDYHGALVQVLDQRNLRPMRQLTWLSWRRRGRRLPGPGHRCRRLLPPCRTVSLIILHDGHLPVRSGPRPVASRLSPLRHTAAVTECQDSPSESLEKAVDHPTGFRAQVSRENLGTSRLAGDGPRPRYNGRRPPPRRSGQAARQNGPRPQPRTGHQRSLRALRPGSPRLQLVADDRDPSSRPQKDTRDDVSRCLIEGCRALEEPASMSH